MEEQKKLEELKVDDNFREIWEQTLSDKTMKIIDAIYCRLVLKEEKDKNRKKIKKIEVIGVK